VVKAFGEQIGQDISVAAEFLHGRDILDLIQEFRPEGLASNTFINLLEPIKPRLYSIASSLKAYEDEVHITVTRTGFESLGRWRKGVCSNFVADASEDSNLRVYIHENEQFRLPKDPSQAIVMVGAGTGIAPFRAFLQEREAIGATGKNWLFFGERRFRYDFLYQTEWQALQKSGVLTHIDLAFSRDQARKIYVQHKMLEKGKALFDWLENGASIYVCGDANFMAKDVEKALKTIIETQGREPETYLDALKTEGRYQRDVY
jgi:sulfite reductase (NADPH) flavoprotein alpha-component